MAATLTTGFALTDHAAALAPLPLGEGGGEGQRRWYLAHWLVRSQPEKMLQADCADLRPVMARKRHKAGWQKPPAWFRANGVAW